MSDPVPLAVQAGVPYRRRFRVVGGASMWETVEALEVRAQVRAGRTVDSRLRFDLTPFLVPSIDGEDVVVDLVLTGADTRLVQPGYFDVLVTDVGGADAQGVRVPGVLVVSPTTTAAVAG